MTPKIAARSWRLFSGNFAQQPLGAISLGSFVHGKPPLIASTSGPSRGCGHIFFDLRGEIDSEWVFADGSYVRAHQHASGARLGAERAIGKSRRGPTTKIHMAYDAHRNPIDFEITGGEVHDVKAAPQIIEKVKGAENFIADKGYDSEVIREQAQAKGMNPAIPRKSNSKKPNPEFDSHLYKIRHLVENLFARLKHFRSVATRFEKLARNFKAIVFLACTVVWLKIWK